MRNHFLINYSLHKIILIALLNIPIGAVFLPCLKVDILGFDNILPTPIGDSSSFPLSYAQ
jgi:hypothetical protein